jgi:2-methylisocitrate lyase-like PEP mutase family enzyme
VQRLQAFEEAGADVLFAPGLPELSAVQIICGSLKNPFNFMVGIPGKSFSVAQLAAAGVRRISLATSLYRAAMTGFLDAAREIQNHGTFTFLDRSLKSTGEIVSLMET